VIVGDSLEVPLTVAAQAEDEAVAAFPVLRLTLVSLFPSIFASWLQQGVVARAVERGLVTVDLVDLRPFGVGKHRITDDYPFGGGAGMVMKPEPVFEAVESLHLEEGIPIILLSPRGRTFTQRTAEKLADQKHLVLVSGHYEGVDERVREHLITHEISIGDYVLSAGELAAMVVSDAVTRLVPGVLAASSTVDESFSSGLLEYPQYTRPAVYRNWEVPPVLLSGHHSQVDEWRRKQSEAITAELRPDLLSSTDAASVPRKNASSSVVEGDGAIHSGSRNPATESV
jgi:tRNA (guanine37-N1)-methyltransferase